MGSQMQHVEVTGQAGGAVHATLDAAMLEREIRGRLYQELDLLAYALEMEAAEQIEQARDDDAARTQQTRLGIRLAQRLVGGVPAPEVDRRLDQCRAQYQAKFPE
jgi:hypothetical protein